ncbi:MAG: hypothetical protein AB8G15_11100 [Saprospiraceae bacterium]
MSWGDLLLLITLLGIIYEDFNYRGIHWWWLLLLLLSILGWRPWNYEQIVINWGFLISQFILLTAYFSFKRKAFTCIIDQYLGLGDILFLLVIAILFSPFNFLLFFLGSLITSLVFFLVYQSLFPAPSAPTIPLAGAMAITLIIVLFASEIFKHPIHLDYFTLRKFSTFWSFNF